MQKMRLGRRGGVDLTYTGRAVTMRVRVQRVECPLPARARLGKREEAFPRLPGPLHRHWWLTDKRARL